jgi:hypothetical protein
MSGAKFSDLSCPLPPMLLLSGIVNSERNGSRFSAALLNGFLDFERFVLCFLLASWFH